MASMQAADALPGCLATLTPGRAARRRAAVTSDCSQRPPGDNFEKANTAAAEPKIAGHGHGARAVDQSGTRRPCAPPGNAAPLVERGGRDSTALCTATRSGSHGMGHQR